MLVSPVQTKFNHQEGQDKVLSKVPKSCHVFLASHHWKDNYQIVPKRNPKETCSILIDTSQSCKVHHQIYDRNRVFLLIFVVCHLDAVCRMPGWICDPRLTATDRFLYGFAWRRFVKDCEEVYKTSGKRILRLGF